MTLLPHHAAELIDRSGIDPAIVASRGYRSVTAAEAAALGFADYQARAGLLMPQWTLAGAQVGYLLKPDVPRSKPDGKPLKYEAPEGSVSHFDIHPDALPALRDPSQPIDFTEGNKKGDAGLTHGLAVVSLSGVWKFLRGRLVVPDLDELLLEGRRARVIFDSDVTRKPEVEQALLRFCDALHRRGAIVEVVYLPEGPDGAKVGLDDYFVADGAVEDLAALARPWNGMGPGMAVRSGVHADDADRRYLAAEADRRALIQAINTAPSLTELRAAVSTGTLVLSKLSRGDVDANGEVVVSSPEISHDHRAKPEPGARKATTNPDGTLPRMARSNVKPIMTQAIKSGAIRAKPIPVDRKHASGAEYRDTAWVVSPVASLADFLNPWIATKTPKERKPRTLTPPCPNCGEVHAETHIAYCDGCGAEKRRRTVEPETGDTLSPVKTPSLPAPSLIGTQTISGLPEEPSWLAAAPPPEWGDKVSPVVPAHIHAHLADASRSVAPEPKQALYAGLANVARARGRTPAPKPSRTPRPAPPDRYAEYAPGAD